MKTNKSITVLILALIVAACSSGVSEKDFIGVWEHAIESQSSVEINGKKMDMGSTTVERFNFTDKENFTFGEYSTSSGKALYSVSGKWSYDSDSKQLAFEYPDGSKMQMDVREFDGSSFITTSKMGNDFKFEKK